MQFGTSCQIWAGRVLHFVPLILATILVFSIVALGLAAAYGKQLADAPSTNPYPGTYPSRSNAYFVFYSGTMPVLSIVHSTIDLIIYSTIGLNVIYALTGSLIFLCGWGIQFGFWECDIAGNWFEESACYQNNLQQTDNGYGLAGVSTDLGNVKGAFGIFLLVLYLIYVCFASTAVHKRRVQRKSDQIGMKTSDSSEHGMAGI